MHELDLKILATDIDETILSKAKSGQYPEASLANLPFELPEFGAFDEVGEGTYSVPKKLREMVSIKRLNLHNEWPMKYTFDVIMCRNVVIYFDADHQAALWPRFFRVMRPSGWLFLGHSERIHPVKSYGFVAEGLTTYKRIDPASTVLTNGGA